MATPDDSPITVLLCIDVEPDPRHVDPVAKVDWPGFENAFALIAQLRPQMERATARPAHLSWFLRMDPQITHVYGDPCWVAERYRALFDVLHTHGDEFGIHLHPWLWDHERSAWIQDFEDQAWVTHCVESAFAAFERAFDTTCRAFRLGDRWMNDATMALITELGATTDSTIEPGRVGTETPDEYRGTFPDYTSIPKHPYRPSRIDFKSPQPDPVHDIMIVPVQTAPAAWASTPPTGVDGAIAAADWEGSLDAASTMEIAGWVWDRSDPERIVDVELFCDGELLAIVGATGFRDDLLEAAKGDGRHAFRLATPRRLQDGEPHFITARIAGTGRELFGSPLVLQGLADPDSEVTTLYLDHHPLTFELLVDRILAEPTTTLLTLKVRSDFGSSLRRSSYVRVNIEHMIAHPLAPRFEFATLSDFVRRWDRAASLQ